MSHPTKLKTGRNNKFVPRVPTPGRWQANEIFKSTKRVKNGENPSLEEGTAHSGDLGEHFRKLPFPGTGHKSQKC